MSARYIVRKADGVPGDPIPEDEPCCVIRGQDVLAMETLGYYLSRYQLLPAADPQVISELQDHYNRIDRWQREHPDKLKVADR